MPPKLSTLQAFELLETLPEATVISESDGTIVFVNHSTEKLFGYKKEELLGKEIEILIPKRFRKQHIKYRKNYNADPKPLKFNERPNLFALRKNKTEFPAKVMLSPLTIGEKTFIICLIEDISAQRYFHEKFKLLSTLINETTDAIEIVDPETACFLDGNETAWKSLGYTRDEFLSLQVQDIDPLITIQTFKNIIQQLRKQDRLSIQSIHKRKDGSTFPVEINIKYVRFDKDYLITVVRDVTELKKAQDVINHQAKYDSLTELPNRNMLRDTIDQETIKAKTKKSVFSLLILNINHFKEINNTVGYYYGDQLLKHFSLRVKRTLNEKENIFCTGGDEFAIILCAKIEKTIAIVDKIIKILEDPFIISNIPINVEVSIGIACYPRHATTKEHLIQKAGIALDIAKKQGGFVIYNHEYNQYNPEHLTLMGELRQGLSQDELTLYYQPKIDIQENRISGLEALVRWNNPRRGLLLPNKFIYLAEKTALITPLTFWTLYASLKQSLLWKKQGIDIAVSINISPKNFLNKKFSLELAHFLKHEVKNQVAFEFEITENTIMSDPNYAVEVIQKIQELGATFSIDDFGKDHSSLNYLKYLPVNILKIDKSFIIHMLQNSSDEVIVQSIITLAHNLGIKVIAEGVNKPALLNKLKLLGCDIAQGYYLGKPMPAEEIKSWLRCSIYHL